MIRKLPYFVLVCLAFSLSVDAKQIDGGKVFRVYTHDCCGRGSYTVVIVEGGASYGSEVCDSNIQSGFQSAFAMETSHPNHDAFLSIGMAAMMSGITVDVYGNRSGCIGPFHRADGIAIDIKK